MEQNNILSSTGETLEYAKIYMEQQAEYLQLEIAGRTAKVTSNILTIGVISILVLLTIVFLSFALGFYLGDVFESNALAFLCVGGIYIILTVLIVVFKETIITNPILSSVIKDIID